MRYRPIGTDPDDPRLGRFIPDDDRHLQLYPMTALPLEEQPSGVPVVAGFDWHEAFDRPARDSAGRWWVARDGRLGAIRGGHCVCFEPGGVADLLSWWRFYDQINEGACVFFGASRAMSLFNRQRYNARWGWDRAKERDQWSETNPGDNNGTSVRAGMEVLHQLGHVPWQPGMAGAGHAERARYQPRREHGISAYRWLRSVDEIHRVLANPIADKLGALPYLNSWGENYPRRVWMPDSVVETLLGRWAEFAAPTDR